MLLTLAVLCALLLPAVASAVDDVCSCSSGTVEWGPITVGAGWSCTGGNGSPDGDDFFDVRGTCAVKAVEDLVFNDVTSGSGIAVSSPAASFEMTVNDATDALELVLPKGGIQCTAGSCSFVGAVRKWATEAPGLVVADHPPLRGDPDGVLWEAGEIVPCAGWDAPPTDTGVAGTAQWEPDCAGGLAVDPGDIAGGDHLLGIVWPEPAPGNLHLAATLPDVDDDDMVCFWGHEHADYEPAEHSYCFDLVDADAAAGGSGNYLRLDVQQGRDIPGYPQSRRRFAQFSLSADFTSPERCFDLDDDLEDDQEGSVLLRQGQWVYLEEASGTRASAPFRVVLNDDVSCSGVADPARDSVRLVRRLGLDESYSAGAVGWIGAIGVEAGDRFYVAAPVQIGSASGENEKDSIPLFSNAATLRHVRFRETGRVTLTGGVDLTKGAVSSAGNWIEGCASPCVLIQDAGDISLDHWTMTASNSNQNTHAVLLQGSVGNLRILNSNVRYMADDALDGISGAAVESLSIDGWRCQYAIDNARSAGCVDLNVGGGSYGPVVIRNMEVIDWGGTGVDGSVSHASLSVERAGVIASDTQAFWLTLPGDHVETALLRSIVSDTRGTPSSQFIVRMSIDGQSLDRLDLFEAPTMSIGVDRVKELRNSIWEDYGKSDGDFISLGSQPLQARFYNVIFANPMVEAATANSLFFSPEIEDAEVHRVTFAFDEGNAQPWRSLVNGFAGMGGTCPGPAGDGTGGTCSQLRMGGLLIANADYSFGTFETFRGLDSGEAEGLLPLSGGFCQVGWLQAPEIDPDAATWLFSLDGLLFGPDGDVFEDPEHGIWNVREGVAAAQLGCGALRGVDAPGIRGRIRAHKWSKLPARDLTGPDTDGDGLSDLREVDVFGTNPLGADSDQDGLSDWAEVDVIGTNPLAWDTDNDGLPDGAEVDLLGSDPNEPDAPAATSLPASSLPGRGAAMLLVMSTAAWLLNREASRGE